MASTSQAGKTTDDGQPLAASEPDGEGRGGFDINMAVPPAPGDEPRPGVARRADPKVKTETYLSLCRQLAVLPPLEVRPRDYRAAALDAARVAAIAGVVACDAPPLHQAPARR